MSDAGALRVAWFRTATTFRSRRSGLVTLVLLVGLVGGLAMGALAAARRTQSAFATYLTSINASNLTVSEFGGQGNGGGSVDLSAAAVRRVAQLPGVTHVARAIPITAAPLRPDGAPVLDNATLQQALAIASLGIFFDQDRATVLQGRMANPNRADEIVMTATAAHLLGFHLGEVIPYGLYTPQQQALPDFGTASVPPHRLVRAKLVGIVQVSNAVVEDDIDRYPTFVIFTPKLAHEIVADNSQVSSGAVTYGLQLRAGDAGAKAVEESFPSLIAPGLTYDFHAAAPVEEKVDLTVKPLAIALGVFGGIAALAVLLTAMQVISRQLRAADDDLTVLRALGAGTTTVAADTLIGLLGAIVAGAVAAAVVAVALSPLAPLGPVRPVYPGSAIAFDWTVLGLGVLALVVGLGAVAVVLTYRGAPHRVARRRQKGAAGTSRIVRAATSRDMPAPVLVGMRFALEPGHGRTAVPVRSALLGSALAVALVVATFTFGSGLQSLVSHPSLYGWNWTYILNPSNIVPNKATALLNHDRDVAAWSPYDYNDAELDGQNVPFLFEDTTQPTLTPPLLSGHNIAAKNQIVLGAATMVALHTHLGGTVYLTYGNPKDAPEDIPSTPFVVVGTATMPAVGFSSLVADHTSMGTGALISEAGLPAAFRQAAFVSQGGANLVFVRMRAGISAAAGRADLQRVAEAADRELAALPGGRGWARASRSWVCNVPPRSSITGPSAPPPACSPGPW